MNKIQKEIRNRYLVAKIGSKKSLDFSSGAGLCELWMWAQNQEWWHRNDFLMYLRANREDSEPLVNSIYEFMKDGEGERSS